MFNTLIRQDHPGNLRRFGFPSEFRNWRAKIFVDHDRDLGTPNRDEALIADPAQAVIAMEPLGPVPQSLCERTFSINRIRYTQIPA